jgi:hypothetical protein
MVRRYGALVMLSNGCVGLLKKKHLPRGEAAVTLGDAVRVVVLAYDQELAADYLGEFRVVSLSHFLERVSDHENSSRP